LLARSLADFLPLGQLTETSASRGRRRRRHRALTIIITHNYFISLSSALFAPTARHAATARKKYREQANKQTNKYTN